MNTQKMKKSKFKTALWFLFYFFIFLYLLKNSFSYLDNDLGWHLRVGEQILKDKAVPSLEYYDYTLEGKTWVDHEWLMNAGTYYVYKNFGYVTLNVIFALIVTLTLIVLTFFTKKYFLKEESTPESQFTNLKGDGFIMLFQLFGVIAMSPHLGVRMQEISLLFMLILLVIIHNFSQKKNFYVLLWLLPLFYFWACLHAGFLIGLFLLFFFAGTKILENILKKIKFFNFLDFEHSLSQKNIFMFLSFSFLAIFTTLITPYGLKLYSFLSEYTNTFYMKKIAEWLPAYYLPIQYAQLFYAALTTTILFLYLYLLMKQRKSEKKFKVNLWYLLLTLLFLVLSFKSKRHFPLFFISSFVLTIQIAQHYFIIPKKWFNFFTESKIIKSYLAIGLIILSFAYTFKINFNSDPFSSQKYYPSYPFGATNYLKTHPEYNDYRILNDYSWGGYLIWAYPEKKLFIDGRLPQYQFAGHTMLEEYFEFFNEEKTANKLEEYNVKIVMIRLFQNIHLNWFEKYILKINENEINDVKNNLLEYLKNSDDWSLIYEDPISNLYVKNK